MPPFRSLVAAVGRLALASAVLLTGVASRLSAQAPSPPPTPVWRVILPGSATPVDSVAAAVRLQLPTGVSPGLVTFELRDPAIRIDSVRLVGDTAFVRRILTTQQVAGQQGASRFGVQLRADSLDRLPGGDGAGLGNVVRWSIFVSRSGISDSIPMTLSVTVVRELRGRLTVQPKQQGPIRYVIGMRADSLPSLGWLTARDADQAPRRLCVVPDSVRVNSLWVKPPVRCGAASPVRPIVLDSVVRATYVPDSIYTSEGGWLDRLALRWMTRPPVTPDSVQLRWRPNPSRDSLFQSTLKRLGPTQRTRASVLVSATPRLVSSLSAGQDSSEIALRVWARPVLGTDQPRILVEWRVGDPAPVLPGVTIRNLAPDGPDLPTTLAVAVAQENGPPQWLRASLSRLTPTPAQVQLQLDPSGFVPGDDYSERLYTARVLVMVPLTNDTLTIPVQITVRPPRGTIGLSKTALRFGQGVRDAALLRDTLTVRNILPGGLPTALGQLRTEIRYSGTATGWLDARLSSTRSPAVLTLEAQGRALGRGTYQAEVVVRDSTSTNREVILPVTLVMGDAITLVPDQPQIDAPAGAGRGTPWVTQMRVTASQGTLRQLGTRIEILQGPELLQQGTPWIRTRWIGTQTPAVLEITVEAPAGWASHDLQAQILLTSSEARDGDMPLRLVLPKATRGPARLTQDTLRFGVDPLVPLASQPFQRLQIDGAPERWRLTWVDAAQAERVGLSLSYPVPPDDTGWLGTFEPGPIVAFPVTATLPPVGRHVLQLRITLEGGAPDLLQPVVVIVPPRAWSAPELAAFLRPRAQSLNAEGRAWLDAAGNQNGRPDVGDVAAILSRRQP